MSAPSSGPGSTPTDDARMIVSGIAPLDEHLGGIAAHRIHLISGPVGTGKTSACLQFLGAGLQAGERAAILTVDEPADLGAHARFLGVGLSSYLRQGRLVALNFRPGFFRRFAAPGSYSSALDELRTMVAADGPPGRIVIDPLSPFLRDGSAIGAGIAALADFLDGLGATALLTCNQPLVSGADRRLDPLIDRAATILSLEHDADQGQRIIVWRARPVGARVAPLPFPIGEDQGQSGGNGRASGPVPPAPEVQTPRGNRLLLVAPGEADPSEAELSLLGADYDVGVEESPYAAAAIADRPDVAGLLILAQLDTLAAADDLLRGVAETPGRPPIIVVLRGRHRSDDRARLLRGGADEVLPGDLGAAEFRGRLAIAVRSGPGLATQRLAGAAAGVPPQLSEFVPPKLRQALAQALAARPPLEDPVRWAVMVLTPRAKTEHKGITRAAVVERLEEMVLGGIRTSESDRAVAAGGSLAVYLHDVTSGNADAVATRLRGIWRSGMHGALRVQIFSHPVVETQALSAAPAAESY